MANSQEVFIHDVRLPQTNRFAERFNEVSDMYAKANDPALSDEDRDLAMDAFISAKYCLEMGIGC